MSKSKAVVRQSSAMRYFSTLAGPFQKLTKKTTYNVQFKSISSYDNIFFRIWSRVVALLAILFVIMFTLVLFQPDNWIIVQMPDSPIFIANAIMLGCLIVLQIFIIIGTLSSTSATLLARNPLPVRPARGLRVAFVTTRAPGEPIDLVRKTLEAIKRVKYSAGKVDVWLLDETKDSELKRLCDDLGVHYFSRKGVYQWNTKKISHSKIRRFYRYMCYMGKVPKSKQLKKTNPFFAAKTKHGNFNSWSRYLKNKGYSYDFLAGVDTDHVPEPNFLQRTLGYFRDPNIAYVVGPQVYGNYAPGLEGLVCRWAESQASFFQSTIQRAGNASHSPMFVGTNYVIRFSALDQVGGFQPCITEDMATGLAIHSTYNPDTGKKWQSVYTPDVLAIGEGPTVWGSFFTQQWRWAAGTFDTWRRVVWRIIFRLPPRTVIHYLLILTYYPIAALTWILAIISSLLYLSTGATAILAPWNQFVSLYLMSLVMQLSLYFWNRRYNVSPHEPMGSYGVAGMAVSALTAPIYFSALIGIMLGKKPGFVVTKKGESNNLDHMLAFKAQYLWAAIIASFLTYGALNKHNHPAMLIWCAGLLAICIAPILIASGLHFKTFILNIHKSDKLILHRRHIDA